MLENTNIAWIKLPSLSNAKEFLSNIKTSIDNARNNTWQDQQNSRVNDVISLTTHWAAATDQNMKKCYDKACRMETAAWMVSAFDWTTWNYKDVISNFINKHDTEDKSMYNAFYDYIQNGTIDSDELAYRTIDKVNEFQTSNDDTYNPLEGMDTNEYNPFQEGETAPEESDSSMLADLAQIPIDYLWRPTKWAMKKADEVAAWLAKKLWSDEETVDEMSQNYQSELDAFATLPWVNRDDLTYILADFGTDVGLTALIAYALKNPEYALLRWGMKWKRVEKAIKAYPKLSKILLGSYKWWRDMAIMDALEWEFDMGDISFWALLWGWWAWVANTKRWKSISNWLQTNWVMTPTRMKRIIDNIKDTVDKVPTLSDVADFMTKYWITWTQSSIIKKSEAVYKQAMAKVDAIISKIEWTKFSEAARDSVDWLIERISKKDAPMFWKKSDLERLNKLKEKAGNFTAAEIEKIKRFIDSEISLFTNKWEVIEWYEYIVKARNAMQKELEESAKHLWDLWQLNNVVRTSFSIMKWAEEKMSYDGISQWFAKRWLPAIASIPAYQKLKEWDYVWALKEWIWPLIASSKWLKTHLWSMLNRLSWTSRSEFSRWLTSEWREKLSEWATEEMAKLLNSDNSFKEFIKELWVLFTENLLYKTAWEVKNAGSSLSSGVETGEFDPWYWLDK